MATGFAWRAVPWTDVTIDDCFWAPRQRVTRERTLPHIYRQCESTGRIDALRLAWQPGQEPVPHIFWDSDVAKWLEAASYSLGTHPDTALAAHVDGVIALLAAAQQPDGYLNSHFTAVQPGKRWTNLRDAHELYCAGHLIEAGVAHYAATGQRTLLDIVRRYADGIDAAFGRAPGQRRGYCGHEEIELALVKLYHATGDERYLRLSHYFVDERGREPYYFDLEEAERGPEGAAQRWRPTREYNQTHRPVREQHQVVGHAVRAMYLYSAMADLAGETADGTLLDACRRLWRHLGATRLYLTGGIGSSGDNEGFTADYDLPNEAAYAETCAAIGLVLWAHRMALLEGDARYADVMECALYNGVLSGVALDGTRFFYENPLASAGDVARQPWYECACCPPNLARLLASLGGYIYATTDAEVAVQLYVGGSVHLSVAGHTILARQETDYPWDGAVALSMETDRPLSFALLLRVPGWCQEPAVRLNGAALDLVGVVSRGYARIEREWRDGDRVELDLPMPVARIYADPRVAADVGCVAVQRGPLVYCFEAADNDAALQRIVLPRVADLSAHVAPALLDGVTVITGTALTPSAANWGGALYRAQPPALDPTPISAIPYYAWANREPGPMRVWLHEG
jgi:DUF1680 family protein